jgi:hypothetical protein
MGICGCIKQISTSTLNLLREEPALTEVFIDAKKLPSEWAMLLYFT